MKKVIIIVIISAIMLGILSACSILQKLGLKESPDDELRPVSSIIIGEAEASQFTDKTPIRLYFANEDNTKLKLEIRYIDTSEAKKSISYLASIIIDELIKGPSDETMFTRTVPVEAKLNSPVSISGKVATVDMSKEFKTKHPGGKDAERMTIYSIVNSLTELKEIEKVKFTIDGKVQKEFMGNFRFNASFPRSTQLISREADGNASGSIIDNGSRETDSRSTGQSGETIDGFDPLE